MRDIATLASLASHQNKGGENEERTEWIAESAMHVADLLRKYRAHKIRDGNQDQFQRVNLEMLSLYAAVKLSDWWGKVGHTHCAAMLTQLPNQFDSILFYLYALLNSITRHPSSFIHSIYHSFVPSNNKLNYLSNSFIHSFIHLVV